MICYPTCKCSNSGEAGEAGEALGGLLRELDSCRAAVAPHPSIKSASPSHSNHSRYRLALSTTPIQNVAMASSVTANTSSVITIINAANIHHGTTLKRNIQSSSICFKSRCLKSIERHQHVSLHRKPVSLCGDNRQLAAQHRV